ncbi:hypothetical protein L1887_40546 [Cichorium endivia]|nr:hypothetical protein L1887_40546 [Cichorium endivia]
MPGAHGNTPGNYRSLQNSSASYRRQMTGCQRGHKCKKRRCCRGSRTDRRVDGTRLAQQCLANSPIHVGAPGSEPRWGSTFHPPHCSAASVRVVAQAVWSPTSHPDRRPGSREDSSPAPCLIDQHVLPGTHGRTN